MQTDSPSTEIYGLNNLTVELRDLRLGRNVTYDPKGNVGIMVKRDGKRIFVDLREVHPC